jgi:hypothetical protein
VVVIWLVASSIGTGIADPGFSSSLAFGILSRRKRFVLIWVLLSGGKKFGFDIFFKGFFFLISHVNLSWLSKQNLTHNM